MPLVHGENGGTAFEVGSHVAKLLPLCRPAWSRASDAPPGPLSVRPAAAPNVGDIYVYDLRVHHFGMPFPPSTSAPPRPLLSLPYVKNWYVDAVNHPTRHTDGYGALDDVTKKLLVRVDTRQHHEALFQAAATCEEPAAARKGWF